MVKLKEYSEDPEVPTELIKKAVLSFTKRVEIIEKNEGYYIKK